MIHLVSFSAVTWNFPLIGRTRMLTEAWHRLGIPTTFVQAPFLRTAIERMVPFGRADGPIRVLRPWPTYPRRLWPRLAPARLLASIQQRAAGLRRQLDGCIDWNDAVAVVVSPLWTPWLTTLPFRHVIYDCIDDLTVHIPRRELRPLYTQWETELIARADAAVTTAEQLHAALHQRRSDLPLALIRNGVDADRFAQLAAAGPRPADLPPPGRPMVGFVGAMYEWLDWDLIEQTVRALPEFDFIFIGPHDGRGQVTRLQQCTNAHVLGRRPYDRVPAYVAACDVCWVPFRAGEVAASANPVKIYEYLALGKPVVATPVADPASFEGLVSLAHGAEDMARRLREAVTASPHPTSADAVPATAAHARTEFARRNSWEGRAREYAQFADRVHRTQSD